MNMRTQYFNILIFCFTIVFFACKSEPKIYEPINDIDGNIYNVKEFGEQVWMLGDLKVTRYNDGTPLQKAEDGWDTLQSPAYTWHDDSNFIDSITKQRLPGYLYNWYTIDSNSNDGKNICPEGWHIPSSEEWGELMRYFSSEKDVDIPDWILPSGYNYKYFPYPGRRYYDGRYSKLEDMDNDPVKMCWWTTENGLAEAIYVYVVTNTTTNYAPQLWSASDVRALFNHNNMQYIVDKNKNSGYCLRCIKN